MNSQVFFFLYFNTIHFTFHEYFKFRVDSKIFSLTYCLKNVNLVTYCKTQCFCNTLFHSMNSKVLGLCFTVAPTDNVERFYMHSHCVSRI
jgi:hypothetical protein